MLIRDIYCSMLVFNWQFIFQPTIVCIIYFIQNNFGFTDLNNVPDSEPPLILLKNREFFLICSSLYAFGFEINLSVYKFVF